MYQSSVCRALFTCSSLREKCPNTEFFDPYFPAFRLNTERYRVQIRYIGPNAGKYGPEKTPYLDTFYAVLEIITAGCSGRGTIAEWAL